MRVVCCTNIPCLQPCVLGSAHVMLDRHGTDQERGRQIMQAFGKALVPVGSAKHSLEKATSSERALRPPLARSSPEVGVLSSIPLWIDRFVGTQRLGKLRSRGRRMNQWRNARGARGLAVAGKNFSSSSSFKARGPHARSS